MSHPLQLPEIQHLICSGGNLSQHDLCRLALVSRDWFDIVTPVLWMDVGPGILPLLMLLPSDSWCITEEPEEAGQGNRAPRIFPQLPIMAFEFIRPLTQADWSHVYKRSYMVRSIADSGWFFSRRSVYSTTRLRAETAATILAHHHSCLLPNLRRLCLSEDTIEHRAPELVKVMLSPLITHLKLPGDWERLIGDPRILAKRCPDVQELHLAIYGSPVYLSPASVSTTLEAISQWPRMTTIQAAFTYDPRVMACLSQHRGLSTVHIRFNKRPAANDENDVLHIPIAPSFRSLRHITLHCITAAFAGALVRSWGVRGLEEIYFYRVTNMAAHPIERIMQAIGDHCRPKALRIICICGMGDMNSPLRYEHLIPLSRFPHLSEVILNGAVGAVVMEDWQYEHVTRWWPDLEVFKLITNLTMHDANVDEPATTRALVFFARHCSKLIELCIPLTPRRMLTADRGYHEHPQPEPTLRCLQLYSSQQRPLGDNTGPPADTAVLISRLFPRLDHVKCTPNTGGPVCVFWEAVAAAWEVVYRPVRMDAEHSDRQCSCAVCGF